MLGKGHLVLLRRAELKTFVDFHRNEVKNLLMVDPNENVLIRRMMIRKIPKFSKNMPLYDILYEFQKGHSHIAIVYRSLNESSVSYHAEECEEMSSNLLLKSSDNIGAGPAPANQDLDTNEEVQDSQEARTKKDSDHRQRQVLEKVNQLFLHLRSVTEDEITRLIKYVEQISGNNIITSPEGDANELS
ncbi:hypothetical protein RJ641_035700 [Dillenia turbinata]|uniref:Uncharacterized protein n=1 Tax=Dillenia turbinata TaxID=194707 RepID=A0AAN8VJY8_9MAGN